MILVVNAGSSSIKLGLFAVGQDDDPRLVLKALLEEGGPEFRLTARDAENRIVGERHWPDGTGSADRLEGTLDWLERQLAPEDGLLGVGHRIVHGGSSFAAPTVLDEPAIERVASLTPLAPLHQPRALAVIRALQAIRPGLPQVGCFDTAFHQTIVPPQSRYAIPRRYEAEGVRKYGFHGLSYEHIAARLAREPDLAAKRIVAAHLGNGASLCAMQDGRSRDTTMGFTALDGLVMGTRPGTLDPGVVLHLQRSHGLSVEAVEQILYHGSGLLGVSETASDMRVLSGSRDPRAREAVELFCFRAAREIAALACTLGGLDMLVFTGGIGEHAADVRAEICARLAWLGVALDHDANARAAATISDPDSRVAVRIVPAEEERVIARHTLRCVRLAGAQPEGR